MALSPGRVGRHLHFKPVSNLVGVETDGCSHTEKRDVIVFYFLVQSPDGNAEQPGQFLDRESLLLGAQLLNEGHWTNVSESPGSEGPEKL
jgi:hypothetical protein